MGWESFARVNLCHRPTPLEPMERLSEALGGPRLFVKRDDCTGLGLGGNKTRKLEFLIGDAINQGADTVITTGGPQSNHARQTAAAAAKMGLDCVLVLPVISRWHGPLYETNGNLLLDRLFGAEIHILPGQGGVMAEVDRICEEKTAAGHTMYKIPVGGSSPVGALGYVAAGHEFAEQIDTAGIDVDAIVVTTGSCTTHAGLLVGLELAGKKTDVQGISIWRTADAATEVVGQRTQEIAELLGEPDVDVRAQVHVSGDYVGDGYGEPTDAMLEAVQLCARLEGLLLDPVYTGKAMAGLIDFVRKGRFRQGQNVVFWHTGGAPAVFAYESIFGAITEPVVRKDSETADRG